jgi:hypothetical protein
MKLQKVSELGKLAVKVFVDCIEAFLEFLLCELADGVVRGVVVNIGKQNSLREWWLDVLSRAAIAMTAGTNLSERMSVGNKEDEVVICVLCSRKSSLLDPAPYRRCWP